MRNGHPCPKCGGTDVVRCQAKGLGKYDEIPVGIFGGKLMIDLDMIGEMVVDYPDEGRD